MEGYLTEDQASAGQPSEPLGPGIARVPFATVLASPITVNPGADGILQALEDLTRKEEKAA